MTAMKTATDLARALAMRRFQADRARYGSAMAYLRLITRTRRHKEPTK